MDRFFLPSLERRQVVPSRPGEPGGDHLAQDERGAHEHAPDEKEEGKGHRVEAQLLGRHDRKVLQALFGQTISSQKLI